MKGLSTARLRGSSWITSITLIYLASACGNSSTPIVSTLTPDSGSLQDQSLPDPKASVIEELPAGVSLVEGVPGDVLGFTLINADTDEPVPLFDPILEGAVLDLAELPANLSIRADTDPMQVGSVVLELQGPVERTQTENVPPYSLFRDRGGDFSPWDPTPIPEGNYSLTATAYSDSNGTGTAGTPLSLTFQVEYEANFSLIDADTDEVVAGFDPIPEGAILPLSSLPANLSIRANPVPAQVGSVRLRLRGPSNKNQQENVAPYSLFSDQDGDYAPWDPTPPLPGDYSLDAFPFSEPNGGGTALAPFSLSFQIQSTGATPTPSPGPTPTPSPLPTPPQSELGDDLAVANGGSNTVSILLGNGSGGFALQTTFAVGSGPRSVPVGDFN